VRSTVQKLVRTLDAGEVNCVFCHSLNVKGLLPSPLTRMGMGSEATSEFTTKDVKVNYKDKKDYARAAKDAEKAEKKT